MTTPEQFHTFVQDFLDKLDMNSSVYLGIGTFPHNPYNPHSWKGAYNQNQQGDELEIIQRAKNENASKTIIYFLDSQYQRIFDERGWIYVCNSINPIMN